MDSPSSNIWIKGWFDGDYSAIPGIKQQSGADSEATIVKLTSGRFSQIELASGPPETKQIGKLIRQEEGVEKVLVQTPDGQAWISPVQDLHILDWESDSTASILGGGGPRVGRLVGWAYAKVRDPRALHKPELVNLTESNITSIGNPTAGDKSTGQGQANDASTLSNETQDASNVQAISDQSPKSNESPQETSFINLSAPIDQPPLPHPCKTCTWGMTLIIFVIAWLFCSFGWALLAIAPLLIRCFATQVFRSAWTTSNRQQFLESILFFLVGLNAFVYLIWSSFFECNNSSTISLTILFTLVALSFRTRVCWLITLLSWLWSISIFISCQVQDGTCQKIQNIGSATSQIMSDTQNKISQIFRPDRDAQEISGQTSTSDGWTRISVDEAEKRPEKFFNCLGKADRRRDQYVIYMGESALFELNKFNLSEASEPQLSRIGKLIQKYPQTNLVVIGHADKSPHIDGAEGNLALSEKRASSVVDWLTNGNFIKPEHIAAMGAGDRYPLFDTPSEFRGNRRVEIRVICPINKL